MPACTLSKAWRGSVKYDKQDQQGKAAFNERNPHTTQQQEPWQGAQADPKQKQDRAKSYSEI
jgi:hypothetical protein